MRSSGDVLFEIAFALEINDGTFTTIKADLSNPTAGFGYGPAHEDRARGFRQVPRCRQIEPSRKGRIRGSHIKIEGRSSTVRAVVRKGMVVAIRSELCAECRPETLSPDLLALLKVVRRKIGTDGGSRRPVSVATFLQQQMPERSECHLICFWGMCFTCCGFPSDSDSWSCSRLGGSYEAASRSR